MNTALKIEPEIPNKSGLECLAEIRQKLNAKARNPARIYDGVLTEKQREIICFASGLGRNDLTLTFKELNSEARQAIRKTLLLFKETFDCFNNANAIDTKSFYLTGEASVSQFNGHFNPANKLIEKEVN